eukprot:TRINITY_DN1031_c0_g2_i1.p1 TRINITY_DN1031_c0_g2~~TRINITY_DN1031_c0_g2_i1.p1  ORF type:complete len:439 (-),score=65.87 TRINITY_DN1031_c0_g2_i1:39-1355(-)
MRSFSYVKCMHCCTDLTEEGVKRSRCGGCHTVFYDNVTCQKEDWAIHKTECKDLQRYFITAIQPQCPEIDTMTKLLAHPDACKAIAVNYVDGDEGFEQNHGLAIFWISQWRKGSGDVEAMAMLGECYSLGFVPHKRKEGFKLLRRACKEMDRSSCCLPVAQHTLAECYFFGRGVEPNQCEAVKWFRILAKKGHVLSQISLANALLYGNGVEKDEEEALIWFHKAAEQDDEEAQYRVAECYYSGRGVEPNQREAVKRFRILAMKGQVQSQRSLANALAYGSGVEKDEEEALIWFRKAAEQDDGEAQYKCAILLFNNTKIGADTPITREAMKWFRRSAEQGYALAQCALGDIVSRTGDRADAVAWYQKAAAQGCTGALFALGTYHLNGVVVDYDRKEAMRLFCLAADQDYEPAVELARNVEADGGWESWLNLPREPVPEG